MSAEALYKVMGLQGYDVLSTSQTDGVLTIDVAARRAALKCGKSRFQPICEGTRKLTAALLFRRNRATVFDFRRAECDEYVSFSPMFSRARLKRAPQVRWFTAYVSTVFGIDAGVTKLTTQGAS